MAQLNHKKIYFKILQQNNLFVIYSLYHKGSIVRCDVRVVLSHFEYLKTNTFAFTQMSDLSNANSVNLRFEPQNNVKNTKMCTLGLNPMLVKCVMLGMHNELHFEVMQVDVMGETVQKLQLGAQCSSEKIIMMTILHWATVMLVKTLCNIIYVSSFKSNIRHHLRWSIITFFFNKMKGYWICILFTHTCRQIPYNRSSGYSNDRILLCI